MEPNQSPSDYVSNQTDHAAAAGGTTNPAGCFPISQQPTPTQLPMDDSTQPLLRTAVVPTPTLKEKATPTLRGGKEGKHRGRADEDQDKDAGENAAENKTPAQGVAGKSVLERLQGLPTRTVDDREVRAVHSLMNKGMDQHHWGSNFRLIDTMTGEELEPRKASWPYTVETYNRIEMKRRTEWKHGRQYTRVHRKQHLTGECTDFMCGKPPSVDGNQKWMFVVIDGDPRCQSFGTLDAIFTRLFPELHPETSTSGKGTHRLMKISYTSGRIGRMDDELMHRLIVGWSRRLTAATTAVSKGSAFELKGANCFWRRHRKDRRGIEGSYVMGTLVRMPVTLTSEQIRSLPVYTQADFESRLARLEALVAKRTGKPLEKPAAPKAPKPAQKPKAFRKAQPSQGKGTPTPDPAYLPAVCSDAHARTVHAKCVYVATYRELPPDAETLVQFYEALGLGTGERGEDRLVRAVAVLENARVAWVPMKTVANIKCDSKALRLRSIELENLFSRADILSFRRKCGVSYQELAAFELICCTLDFASRDRVVEIMNSWHEAGHLPSRVDSHKHAAFRQMALAFGLLEIDTDYRIPFRGDGAATKFRPGPKGATRREWEDRRRDEIRKEKQEVGHE